MDGNRLTARVLRYWYTALGPEADVEVLEPNGDAVRVRCLLKYNGTDISGDKVYLDDLNERYGPKSVWSATKQAVLSAVSRKNMG